MDNTRYTAINYKGKREYIWDSKGKYIRHNNEFINTTKTVVVDDNELALKKELQTLLKANPYIKNRVKGIVNIAKKIYYLKVWLLTEANDLTQLKNHERRAFKGYHLDHIAPIIFCFNNQIPPEVAADIRNLRFIPHKKNIKKGGEIDDDGRRIIEEIMKKR
jgi:hypothetical protein